MKQRCARFARGGGAGHGAHHRQAVLLQQRQRGDGVAGAAHAYQSEHAFLHQRLDVGHGLVGQVVVFEPLDDKLAAGHAALGVDLFEAGQQAVGVVLVQPAPDAVEPDRLPKDDLVCKHTGFRRARHGRQHHCAAQCN
nr:hypothetical protein [Ralstonia sp. TCR112]